MKLKRFAAAGLAATMALSICPTLAFAEDSDAPHITMMVTDHSGSSMNNEGSDEVLQMVVDYTGIYPEFQWVENGAYEETFGTTLLDRSNMPMILTWGGAITSNILSAAQQGAFWDLTEYLQDSEAYPNLSQANETVLKGLTVNGQIIGIYRARELGRYGFSYRTDWAEAVGITEEPQTIDDVYDMLYKFTYEDPDGNGVNDTYGMEMTKYTGPFDVIQTWFGVGNGWVEEDGQLIPVHMTEEYKEALDWLKKCYDDGLMRGDFATIDTSEWSNGCKKGEAGVYIDVMDGARRIWDYYVKEEVESVVDDSQLASMTLLGPINGKTLATSGYNGFYMITKDGAKTEEDVVNCLTFLDKMNDEDMRILADYGVEGVTYEMVDGLISTLEVADANAVPHYGLNQTVAYIPDLTLDQVAVTERVQVQNEAYARNREVCVTNPALSYLVGSATYTLDGADLNAILEDARTQYICGQIDDAGLEAAWQTWADRGGTAVIEEVNAQYQADQQ